MSAGAPESRIPVSAPDLSDLELANVIEAVSSTWISSTGPFVTRFEREFATLCETEYALSVSNGTVALHLALLALGVGVGEEVLVPALTYIATANAVRYVGAEPVFVDVDLATWCIDPEALEAAITPRTRGIIAVHLYGHPADMDRINAIAEQHGLWVVEDAAEAHLARYKGRRVGGLAKIGTFSFYGNKLFSSGEGGAVVSNDLELRTRLRLLRGQGVDPSRRYYFPIVGHNFRLTNVACALLCGQLDRRDEIFTARHRVFSRYRERLTGIPGIGFQPIAEWAEPAPWLFCVTIDADRYGRTRDELAELLEAYGIETRPFFVPLHVLPPYESASAARGDHLPHTDLLSATGLNLPTFSSLADHDIDRITRAVEEGLRQ